MKKISKLLKLFKFLAILLFIGFVYLFSINIYVIGSTSNRIVKPQEITSYDYDCILVLGAGVYGNTPSPLLKERLDTAIELYKQGVAPKLLMSGDHGDIYYDEVNVMKSYAIRNGVPSEDIFMDHSGFSTYESVYRAKYIYQIEKMVIVTQRYHLYRAIYLSDKFGIESIGVSSTSTALNGQLNREIREILARNKDFIFSIIKPEPSVLGEEIPITGNGDITNDK